MTKKETQKQEAIKTLKEWGVVDGTVINAKVNHVSVSGMSRNIGLYITDGDVVRDISYHVAQALGWGYKEGYTGGVRVGGCGMDMMFHAVSTLSYAMGYGDMCQNNQQMEATEKKGYSGETITAIGLKYKAI